MASTGVIVGGILAIIGAILGFIFLLFFAPSGLTAILSPNILVGAMGLLLVLIAAILAIVFSIVMIAGRAITISAAIVIIAGIISLILTFLGSFWFIIPAALEIIGGIIALATKG